jgi:multidrug efflux pump subunit AcrB
MDEGGFVLDYYTVPGTSLAETNRELEQVEAILKKDPHVDTYSRRTGAGLGGDLKEAYQGDFFIHLTDPSHRPPIWAVMDEVSNLITHDVPGIKFDTHLLLDDMIGDMVGRPQPIAIELSAANPDLLGDVANRVADAVKSVDGIEPASVNNGVVPAGDALEIKVDPAAAAMANLTPAEVEARSSPGIPAQYRISASVCGSSRRKGKFIATSSQSFSSARRIVACSRFRPLRP